MSLVSGDCTDTDLSKMKFVILALCVCAASAATVRGTVGVVKPWQTSVPVPQPVVPSVKSVGSSDAEAPVLRSESDVNAEGFNYVYETGNGIVAEANGNLKKVDNVDAINVKGSYKYVAPDGTPVQFTYVADENGYQPQSDVLPVAPPVPVAIARALEYIAAHPPAPETVKKY